MTNPLDVQIGGDHYKKFPIQPAEYCYKNKLDNLQSGVIKYITRHKLKGGKDDLLKAKHLIDMMIEFEYKETTSE